MQSKSLIIINAVLLIIGIKLPVESPVHVHHTPSDLVFVML